MLRKFRIIVSFALLNSIAFNNLYIEKVYANTVSQQNKNMQQGFKLVIPYQFDSAGSFNEGLASVKDPETEKYGYIDKTGNVVIPYQFVGAGSFNDGLAAAIKKVGFEWGVIDKTGKFVIPPFASILGINEGLLAVMDLETNKCGYIDKTGKFVIQPEFDWAEGFSEGLAVVKDPKTEKYGYIDKTGKFIIQPQFDWAQGFSEGLAAVKDSKTEKYGYIDKTGKLVIPYQFDNKNNYNSSDIDFGFNESLAIVWDNKTEKYGYIDKTGKLVIPYQFDYAGDFGEGLANVKDDETEEWGYIDKTGKLVIPYQFDNAGRFNEGLAPVKDLETGKWGYISKNNHQNTGVINTTNNTNTTKEISVYLNGEKIEFSQNPIVENGYTLVPMRNIFEALGVTISWDQSTKTVTAIKGDKKMLITVNSNVAKVNGKDYKLDAPARNVNGTVLVPLRFVGEQLGLDIKWDQAARRVDIKGETTISYTKEENAPSNVNFDYSKIEKNETLSYYLENLKQVVKNTNDINYNGIEDIHKYLEYSLINSTMFNLNSKDNKVTVNYELLKEQGNNVQQQLSQTNQFLKQNGIYLNKPLESKIIISSNNLDIGKPATIIFKDINNIELGNVSSIQIYINDNEYINIPKNAITNFKIELQKISEGKYKIQFYDKNGNAVDKIKENITFTLNSPSEDLTVFVKYSEGYDNWGGQYDKTHHTIKFATKYSGEYEMKSNAKNIKDINSLTEKQKKSINFMVSKGIFTLDGNNKFNPDKDLTRYTFSEALVKIFFALDRSLSTDFKDVNNQDYYYPYVASGEKANVIAGYEDNTFRGNIAIPKEQVVALCARTLAEKKGYTYPENVDEYLTFIDSDKISKWAKKDIALAVKTGLIEKGGYLNPQNNITRKDSATILYKLYMMLY